MRNYWLGGVLLAIALSWIGNLTYYHSQKLEAPLFLEHYYEIPASLGTFSIYYIRNADSKRDLVSVQLDGQAWYVQHIASRDRKGRLELVEAFLMQRLPGSSEEGLKEVNEASEGKAFFSDGFSMHVTLGQIRIYPDMDQEIAGRLSATMSSGSSGNWTYENKTSYSVNEKVTVAAAEFGFTDVLDGAATVEINGAAVQENGVVGLDLKQGNSFSTSITVYLPKTDERRRHAYWNRLALKDDQGRVVAQDYMNIQPQLYGGDLKHYVKQRKAVSGS
ncbi:hypothetical protein [Paenibacillus sp. NPDC058071]|uniref:hypothetical protein n=1 Tax=Paenibacillus sp. NPDC058071 TaxID=3346326 RepID=UPI0036DD7C12